MSYFVEVVLPVPIDRFFTYKITQREATFLQVGIRVAVPFGKRKIYSALVCKIHQGPPKIPLQDIKSIHQILDEKPIVNPYQLNFWKWICRYYMCSFAEVYKVALPPIFLLESETIVLKGNKPVKTADLTDEEYLVYEALEKKSQCSIIEITKILSKKNVLPILKKMLEKRILFLKETIYERYIPKKTKYVRLHSDYKDKEKLNELFANLSRARKQHQILLTYFSLSSQKKYVRCKVLQEKAGATPSVLKAMEDKGIFEIHYKTQDRITFASNPQKKLELSQIQNKVYKNIIQSFVQKNTTLLHGVTGSGKTEIYIKLIEKVVLQGKQVLFLVPEIALTTQLVERLQWFFNTKMVAYHSKYNFHERAEIWNNVLQNNAKSQIVLGTRSALFLPFSNLGLIIVDEEHEPSYKQTSIAPRYHTRDAAIMLGHQHKAKILLGSATPSVETFYKAQNNKYALVSLKRRFGEFQMPQVQLINIKQKYHKKRMQGHFSDDLIQAITDALQNNEQVILFQNRRGFSPVITCNVCAYVPKCLHCDVSLTYHKYSKELRCHYCHYKESQSLQCKNCNSRDLNTIGLGTQQIEQELQAFFPKIKMARMDWDTTRGKYAYQKMVRNFEDKNIQILVGTQMISKGLDFSNVSLVGVLNADTLLNFPDFKAHERTFQMLVQVSGRAGRSRTSGKVLIQTFNPHHPILQQVSKVDYQSMYKEQLNERKQFTYPPFCRIIKIVVKHKDEILVTSAIDWFAKGMRNVFGEQVLGPTIPSVAWIRNFHIRHLFLKILPYQCLTTTKQNVLKIKNRFENVEQFGAVRLIVEVDY